MVNATTITYQEPLKTGLGWLCLSGGLNVGQVSY